jgi:uncharacterized protein (TIGR02246 family)
MTMRALLSLGMLVLLAGAARADTTADLIAIEQRLTDALQRSDVGAVDALWADDLVWIGLSGKRSSKTEQLAGMKAQAATTTGSTPAVVRVENKDVAVRLYGESAVVTVLSTWTMRTAEGERASDYLATHVWNQRGGQWRLVSAHISRVAP